MIFGVFSRKFWAVGIILAVFLEGGKSWQYFGSFLAKGWHWPRKKTGNTGGNEKEAPATTPTKLEINDVHLRRPPP